MKYLLKQNKEDKGILCDKVTIDGFDYYVVKINPKTFSKYIDDSNTIRDVVTFDEKYWGIRQDYKSILATNNPSIDIPKVVNEVEKLTNYLLSLSDLKSIDGTYESFHHQAESFLKGVKEGYNKSQETHPFSEEDMIEFKIWCDNNTGHNWTNLRYKSTKELLQIWKEQQPKVLYYE